MSDLVQVRLNLRDVRVLEVVVDSVDRLGVGVESALGAVASPSLEVPMPAGVGPKDETGS